MHRRASETIQLDCTGTQEAFLFLNATYESEGKRAEQNTAVKFNPALCAKENRTEQYKPVELDSALCF
jgi:hypothetical protein